MPRLLLLLPSTTYRTAAFVAAARQIGAELTVASEHPSTLESANPAGLLTLDLQNPGHAADQAHDFARRHPIAAVVGVDDDTAVVAGHLAERLRLKGNPAPAATAARALPIPRFALRVRDKAPRELAPTVVYPCVLKPLRLSASRGVIRADNPASFVAAHERLRAIVAGWDIECLV